MTRATSEVTGIGPSTARLLAEHGIETAETLARSSPKQLSSIPGFGPVRARAVLADAAQLVGAESGVTGDGKGKRKDKKKDKKKHKNKKNKQKNVRKAEGKNAKGKKSKDKKRKRKKRKKSKE